ncbi:MAG: tRNA epoxyqueuosine(34) reductase QueG [Bacteroidales bacterium]|nr:tRNA epoxyqueuosine(34) reductase QueG [Bacteroidales bacterium]
MTENIEQLIKKSAIEIGFSFCSITKAGITFDSQQLQKWYNDGKAADMEWLKANMHCRVAPANVFEQAKSIVVCGLNYFNIKPERRGRIAMYALGRDYHKVMKAKLEKLSELVSTFGGKSRICVDTAPILERPIAQLAGTGWIGKSALLINKKYGAYALIGELFTDLELRADIPHRNHCGTCRACVDSCPTGAIDDGNAVDANKCISYHTIENRGIVPIEYRKLIADNLYGCDYCTEACVWNFKKQLTSEIDFIPKKYPDIEELTYIDEKISNIFAGSPIHRIKLHILKRNIAIVFGNIGTINDICHVNYLLDSDNAIVSEHALWAKNEILSRTTIN